MKRFILFNSLNDDIIISEVLSYLEEDNYDKHQYILNRLLEKALDLPIDGDLFKMYLCYLVRQDENLFTIKSEKVSNGIDKNLFNIALNDIRVIKRLFDISEEFCTLNDNKISDNDPIFNIFKYNEDINTIGNLLVDFYYKNGAGIMNYYKGFKWDKNKGLIGIENCDPITFDELIGNEMQLKILINNTESFINGELCNNVLLFGDSGTGKSSSVKAILNKYYNKKLRVIELNKKDFMDLNNILSLIKHRGLKFILFLDDLSFEEFEYEYKNMKALIEGGLEVRPKNVLIYATSNRKNLIREGFNDRQGDEIHARETVEEKHSLAERFGVTLTFSVGNQNDYLNTVYKLAEIYNINLPKETLKREAIKWAALSSGRSNRVAKQFIMSVNSLV
ncbi:ATP-binding protein [Clostridium saudiense]|uniref:ATP-binding protein n=3 Tax=Clostridium saudiense TaxID=1414720 RepID=UPI0018A9F08F|nr:ATP-binding protein [Clostridium saudiense]